MKHVESFITLKECSSILLNYSYQYRMSIVAKTLTMHACVSGDYLASIFKFNDTIKKITSEEMFR